jgi:pantoate--beta-alanine ligase
VRVAASPCVREPAGLARSYPHATLPRQPRARATALSRALGAVERAARKGSLAAGIEAGRRELEASGVEPEYLEARDAENLEEVAELNGRPVLVAVAAQVGSARLIDNVLIRP